MHSKHKSANKYNRRKIPHFSYQKKFIHSIACIYIHIACQNLNECHSEHMPNCERKRCINAPPKDPIIQYSVTFDVPLGMYMIYITLTSATQISM